MSSFLLRVLKADPALVNTTVYFSPTKKTNLACVLRDDGTLSPVSSPDLKFDSCSKLVAAWKQEVTAENGTKLSRNVKSSKLSLQNDLFLKPGRSKIMKALIFPSKSSKVNEPTGPIETPVERARPVTRLVKRPPCLVRYPSPIKRRPCPGFERHRHQAAISKRQWDGARIEFSPVIFERDRCRSIACQGEIVGKRSLCCSACKIAQQRLYEARRHLNKETPEIKRILSTNSQWLTPAELAFKEDRRLEKEWWSVKLSKCLGGDEDCDLH